MKKTLLLIPLLAACLLTGLGQEIKSVNYWSKAHTNWPPMPVPPISGMKMTATFRDGNVGFIYDDTTLVYPSNWASVAISMVKTQRVMPAYWLNTNYLATHPAAAKRLVESLRLKAPSFQPGTTNKDYRTLRDEASIAEIEGLLKTNAAAITNRP